MEQIYEKYMKKCINADTCQFISEPGFLSRLPWIGIHSIVGGNLNLGHGLGDYGSEKNQTGKNN